MTNELWIGIGTGIGVFLILLLLCWCCNCCSLERRQEGHSEQNTESVSQQYIPLTSRSSLAPNPVHHSPCRRQNCPVHSISGLQSSDIETQFNNPSPGFRRVHFHKSLPTLPPPPAYDLTPLLPLAPSASLAEPEKDLEEDLVEAEKEKDSSTVYSTVPTQPKDSVSSDIIETLEDELKTQKATTEILLNRLSKLESRLNKKQNK